MSTGPLVLALLFVVLLIPMVSTGSRLAISFWERTWGRNWRWMALIATGLVIGYLIAWVGTSP